MPRKPSPVRQRRKYSSDLKQRVIYQAYTLRKKTTAIAIDLDMPLRVVQHTLKLWQDIGEVCRSRKGIGRTPIMRNDAVKFMLALIEHSPDIYLDEIQEQLEDQHDIVVSLSTIYITLKRLGMSLKKLSRVAQERCEDARRAFVLEIGGEAPERIVTADESAVNLLTSYRQNGWAFRGLRARKQSKFVRGTRYSILPAITTDGIIFSHITVGSYDGDKFLRWLAGLLEVMNPYPERHSVLVLDNCRIHHVDGVEEMCDNRGIKLIYLPPYSPDLNPTEECFSFIKHYIRRHGQEFRDAVEIGDDADPYLFLYGALNEVTAAHAQAWFSHSGYV
ncbi:hypothetical protein CVT24_002275 [Panaeolus cyanescens]|uniref:Tc1-like transposase DDE domain-containing protein n=1 Tax=Panaeolus cyanescens TaxID=181874 RepID=A0A409X015_9AGAR|nr:hypothetical protein CVT24_002275 [Panaeolus cyanescens]